MKQSHNLAVDLCHTDNYTEAPEAPTESIQKYPAWESLVRWQVQFSSSTPYLDITITAYVSVAQGQYDTCSLPARMPDKSTL